MVFDLSPPMLRHPAVSGVIQSCSVHVKARRLSEWKRAALSAAAVLQVLDSRSTRAVIGVLAAALRSLATKQECAVEVSLFKVCVYIAACFCIWFKERIRRTVCGRGNDVVSAVAAKNTLIARGE